MLNRFLYVPEKLKGDVPRAGQHGAIPQDADPQPVLRVQGKIAEDAGGHLLPQHLLVDDKLGCPSLPVAPVREPFRLDIFRQQLLGPSKERRPAA